MRLRPLPALAALALAACSAPRPSPPPPPPVPPAIVVTLVIDQFAGWIAAERLPLLPPDGGFARLRREGTWYRQARYAHAATDTAPGHASLYTGVPPREHGVMANEVFDGRGAKTSILRDDAARVVGTAGVAEGAGSSAARLRVPTLADDLRARRPDAVVVSVSLKERAAIFGGGRRPTAALWFDPSRDAFVTSTAFAEALPAWSRPHASPEAVRALRATPWTPLDAAWVRAHAATPDDQPGEGDLHGWGRTFPHDFATARRQAGALRASPRGDEAVLALAGAAAEGARDPRTPMLLAVSLSSNDYVGHLFGPDSWEAWDELRRLDAALAAFFARLDALVGPARWAVVLTGDHGVVTLPEAGALPAARPWCGRGVDPWQRPCGTLQRLDPDALGPELQRVAEGLLGAGAWVQGVADPYVYLTPEARGLSPDRHAHLVAALRAHLTGLPAVDRVYDATAVPDRCPDDETVDALVCRSIPRDAGAALYVLLRPGAFFDAGYDVGRGTSHGAPYLHDRAVPLLVRAPGAEPAGRVVEVPVPYTRFRATAARLLGL